MPKPHAHVMKTIMKIKERTKRFGERVNEALLKELNQLHEQQVLLSKKKEDRSYKERKKVLRYLMFLKEKRNGSIISQRPSRQKITTGIYKQGRHKFAYSVFGSNAADMCNRCEGRPLHRNGYSRGIPACRYGTRHPHATRRHYCEADHKIGTKLLQKVCVKEQTWQAHATCETKKGPGTLCYCFGDFYPTH